MTSLRSPLSTLALSSLIACCATPSQESTPPAQAPAAQKAEAGEVVAESRAAYYRGAFPAAKRFVKKSIPKELVRGPDATNDNYVEARGEGGELLGYLRDFVGPVSPAEECPCNPLNLTLAFLPSYELLTILSPAPLQKYGHAEMTKEEQARLVELVKNPSKELVELARVEDVVDATTGATKVELKPLVVEKAGLSTKRITMITLETQRILQGAPMLKDKVRIDEIMAKNLAPLEEARALAAFLPTAESVEVKYRVYLRMANDYALALADKAAPDVALEGVLLKPGLPDEASGDILGVCYKLASQNLRLPLVEACLKDVAAGQNNPVLEAQRVRLQGTLAYLKGDKAGAVAALQRATGIVDAHQDPALHVRYADALASTGDDAVACMAIKRLYGSHALFPGVKELLKTCGEPAKVMAELDAEERAALVAKQKPAGSPAPTLALENQKLEPQDVDLKKTNKVTVLVFFATWCPHCQAEMPRIIAFQEALAKDPKLKDSVQVLAVRTAVERETESYEAFAARMKPNFTVLTDPTMSLAFSQFAKALGITPGLPTVAVVDKQGTVRYLLDGGDYKDTQKELLWAVQSLVSRS